MGTPEMFLFSTTIIHGDLSIVRQDRCRVCETLTISPSLIFSRACSTSSIPTDVYSSREMGHTWHTFSQLNPLKIHWPIGAALLRGTTRKEGVTFAASQKEVLASVGQLCQRDLKSCCFQRGLWPRIWGSFNHFGIDIPFECAYVFVLLLVGFNGYMCDCSSIFITRAFRTCWKQGWHYIVDNLKKYDRMEYHGVPGHQIEINWIIWTWCSSSWSCPFRSFMFYQKLTSQLPIWSHVVLGQIPKWWMLIGGNHLPLKWSQGGMDDENTWKVNESPFCPVPGVNPQLYQLYITLQTCTNP